MDIRATNFGNVTKIGFDETVGLWKARIDVRGNTYSSRIPYLFWTGRLVFWVERDFDEWYSEFLMEGVHCIFVKEDLSDLLEKVQWAFDPKNWKEVEKIRKGGMEFARKYFTQEFAVEYWARSIMKALHH